MSDSFQCLFLHHQLIYYLTAQCCLNAVGFLFLYKKGIHIHICRLVHKNPISWVDYIAPVPAQRATNPSPAATRKAKGEVFPLAPAPAADDVEVGTDVVEVEEAGLDVEMVIIEVEGNLVDMIEVEFTVDDKLLAWISKRGEKFTMDTSLI